LTFRSLPGFEVKSRASYFDRTNVGASARSHAKPTPWATARDTPRLQIGKGAGVTRLSMRVRVNDYSFLFAIAERQCGELHMTQTFVKALGRHSAPAVRNEDEALASMEQT